MFEFAIDGAQVDIPGGWVTVIVAFLTFVVSPVVTFAVTVRLSGKVKHISSDVAATKRDAAVTRDHVANNHLDAQGEPINMREEQDRYQSELVGKLDAVLRTQSAQGRDIGGMRQDVRQLRQDLSHSNERIDELANTIPRDELGRFIKKEKSE